MLENPPSDWGVLVYLEFLARVAQHTHQVPLGLVFCVSGCWISIRLRNPVKPVGGLLLQNYYTYLLATGAEEFDSGRIGRLNKRISWGARWVVVFRYSLLDGSVDLNSRNCVFR